MKELDNSITLDPNGLFPLLFSNCALILAPEISTIFRILIWNGSFSVYWHLANVTPIPRNSSSSFISDYIPISITPIQSKLFERLLAKRLCQFLELPNFLPASQFGFRMRLGTKN